MNKWVFLMILALIMMIEPRTLFVSTDGVPTGECNASTACNFVGALQAAAPGDTLLLVSILTYTDCGHTVNTPNITIEYEMPPSRATFNCPSSTSGIVIDASNVTLNNIALYGDHQPASRGIAINLPHQGVTISNSLVTGFETGVAFNAAFDGYSIVDSEFRNNTMRSLHVAAAYQGLTIKGCKFVGRGASVNAPDSAITMSSGCGATIIDSSGFKNLFATTSAALTVPEFNSMFVVKNCTFRNIANRGPSVTGGALHFGNFAGNASLLVEDCIFDAVSSLTNGGAVAIQSNSPGSQAVFQHNLFTSCSAGPADGGALSLTQAPMVTRVLYCSFRNCSAVHGGAFHTTDLSWAPKFEHVSFEECSANASGGAMYAATGTLQNVDFAGCTATRGAAWFVSDQLGTGGLTLVNASFTRGQAMEALYVGCGAGIPVNLQNVMFDCNQNLDVFCSSARDVRQTMFHPLNYSLACTSACGASCTFNSAPCTAQDVQLCASSTFKFTEGFGKAPAEPTAVPTGLPTVAPSSIIFTQQPSSAPSTSAAVFGCPQGLSCICAFGKCTVMSDVVISGVLLVQALEIQGNLSVTGLTLDLASPVLSSAPLVVQGAATVAGPLLLVLNGTTAPSVAVLQAASVSGSFSSVAVDSQDSCLSYQGEPSYSVTGVSVTLTVRRLCGGLSPGAIGGIAAGCVVAGCLAMIAICVFTRRQTKLRTARMNAGLKEQRKEELVEMRDNLAKNN